jgi:DNA replication and repair protein RecF
VRVTRLSVRDFRSYEAAELRLGPGLTVIAGRNGAGKTNLLEALYFAATGRSCRTANEREVVRFGASLTRLELHTEDERGPHAISVGFQPGEAKHLKADDAPVERLTDSDARPLVAVFLPDRLDLVLGAPALRRSHLDQVVAALWPARAATRREYSAALAQRNALIAAVRGGRSGRGSLPAWDASLARHGIALMQDRAEVVERLRERFASHAAALGLEGGVEMAYRPRSRAARRTSWPQSSPSGSTATLGGASRATAPTATSCRCGATAASCARTARAARSASGSWRSCSPSARSWPPSAAPHPCCCSTT